LKSLASGCKDIEIRKSDVETKTQFLKTLYRLGRSMYSLEWMGGGKKTRPPRLFKRDNQTWYKPYEYKK